jgi:hypothetical protein
MFLCNLRAVCIRRNKRRFVSRCCVEKCLVQPSLIFELANVEKRPGSGSGLHGHSGDYSGVDNAQGRTRKAEAAACIEKHFDKEHDSISRPGGFCVPRGPTDDLDKVRRPYPLCECLP